MDRADRPLTLHSQDSGEIIFRRVPLQFTGDDYSDVFGRKNNKTLGETLEHSRYSSLNEKIIPKFATCLNYPLGKFLLALKQQGDETYRLFLNRYGDLTYSTFSVEDGEWCAAKGVYAWCVGEELRYVGRCRDSLEKRVNHGYGRINPKNCYLDGQSTNCHLNSLITEFREGITLWFFGLVDEDDIIETEHELLVRYEPPWNLQRR